MMQKVYKYCFKKKEKLREYNMKLREYNMKFIEYK